MDNLRRFLKEELKWSQAIIADYANKRRLPAPAFKEGDIVMLDSRNIKTTRPNHSLDHKNLGPFPVTRVINNIVYELKLPEGINIYPVFHPWLLHLDNSNPLPRQIQPPSPLTNVDSKESEHYVDEVINSRIDNRRIDPATDKRGCLMYKFRWTRYNDLPKWEPYWNAAGCPDLVADFHHFHPEKDGPHSTFETPDD